MNINPLIRWTAAGLLLALGGTGCVTTQEPAGPPPATQAEVGYLREEFRRLHARIEATDSEIGRLQSELSASRSAQSGHASAAQVQSVQTQIDDLQRQIRALDAARVQDKKDIYEDISKKVASLIRTTQPPSPPRRSASQTGIEHVVQPGESLSRIAAAYGVRMNVIIEANNLKNPDNLIAGQKLFIPE